MSYIYKLNPGEQKLELGGLTLPYPVGMRFKIEGVEYQITKRREQWDEVHNVWGWGYEIKRLPDQTGDRWTTTNYRIRKAIYQKRGKVL